MFLAACAGRATEAPRERAAVRSDPPRRHSEHVEAARGWPRAAVPFVSRGHGGGSFMIDIRISPESLEAARTLVLGRTVPIGTSAVAFHSHARSSARESIFAMSKRADGTWDFLVADPSGGVVSEGALPLCVRCHADAPADFLFVPAEVAESRLPSARDGGPP
jgi:hypothetical protein